MIDVTAWIHNFLQILNETFANRVWFVGLQGSYGRGEATETSDIDIVVILDELSAMDIQTYRDMLDSMSHRELICGFLSGKKEIMNWEPSDLFQFCHDTTPIKGSLDDVMAVIDENAVSRAIKIGACNIFHGCVHNMLYEKAKIFCGDCINLPHSLYKQLLSSKPETISAIKKNCSRLYLLMNGSL